MKKRKFTIIILIIIAALLFIIAGVILTTSSSKSSQKPPTINQENNSSNKSQIILADFEKLPPDLAEKGEIKISKELIDLSKKVYPLEADIDFKGQPEIFISITNYRTIYNLDIKSPLVPGISCNENATGIVLFKQENEVLRIPKLSCK